MIYAVKMNGDRVELYDAQTGSYQRCVCSDAISATVQGNVVAVNKRDGRTEIYDADTILELQRFILVKKKFQAKEGFHDDLVMSLAIGFCLFNDKLGFRKLLYCTSFAQQQCNLLQHIVL